MSNMSNPTHCVNTSQPPCLIDKDHFGITMLRAQQAISLITIMLRFLAVF